MNRILFILSIFTLVQVSDSFAQNQVKKVKIDAVKALITPEDELAEEEQLIVVNFWATWCRPCIQELPYFERVHKEFPNFEVKVYLIAIEDELEKVQAFINKKKISAEIWLLDEKDPNDWIPQIYEDWGGDIPVTLFVHKGKMLFHQGIYPEEKLMAQIRSYLK